MTSPDAARPIALRDEIVTSVRPPGSKSITNRAFVCAALASGTSLIRDPLVSEDSAAMRRGLRSFGILMEDIVDEHGRAAVRVRGMGGKLGAPTETIDVHASGTTARFLTAAATLAKGPSTIDGTPRMRERPILDLTDALERLGATAMPSESGCPPVLVRGGGLAGGRTHIDVSRSSQFTTALMLVAPCAADEVTLDFVDGVVTSRPYLDTTVAVMSAFGARADLHLDHVLIGATGYAAADFAVPADASAAVYPWLAAAITGGSASVTGLTVDIPQADVAIAEAFALMGCDLAREADSITVSGPPVGDLVGVDLDLSHAPDGALAVAVACLFAGGPSTLRGLHTLRLKETDRLLALVAELTKLGAQAHATDEGDLHIVPGPPDTRGTSIATYDDHRMAMSFACAGLRIPNVVIEDPDCVAKTWPGYWEWFDTL